MLGEWTLPSMDFLLPSMHSRKIVCGDLHFASVPAASIMMRYGIQFVRVVKSASQQHPLSFLSQVDFINRGARKGKVTKSGETNGNPK
jgi:hypothetical protein